MFWFDIMPAFELTSNTSSTFLYVEDHHLPWKARWLHQSHQSFKKWPTKSWSCFKCCLTKARFPSWKFHHERTNKNILLMERTLHQLIARLSHYWRRFIYARWLFGISSINRQPYLSHHRWESQLISRSGTPSKSKASIRWKRFTHRCWQAREVFFILGGPCCWGTCLCDGKRTIPWNWTKRTMKHKSSWWFQPNWKKSQIGNLPQVGVKIKNIWNHQVEILSTSWSKTTMEAEVKKISLFKAWFNQTKTGMSRPLKRDYPPGN